MDEFYWEDKILNLVKIKQELVKFEDLYHKQYFNYSKASGEQIEILERKLNIQLPLDYRTFLSYVDGWENFAMGVNLLSTNDIINENYKDILFPRVIDFDEYCSQHVGYYIRELMPIAVSVDDMDTFFMVRSDLGKGTVIWMAPYEIERYSSFSKFFEDMVKGEKETLQDLYNKENGI